MPRGALSYPSFLFLFITGVCCSQCTGRGLSVPVTPVSGDTVPGVYLTTAAGKPRGAWFGFQGTLTRNVSVAKHTAKNQNSR